METIFAQATALGRAGVSVIRVSGPQTFDIVEQIAGPLPTARKAALRRIKDPDGALIDEGLVLTFPGPNSFTGEDVAELHLHGSIAVVQAVLLLLGGMKNTRLAEPGEFTRRALENNRLDLTQVEGLADLIESETEAQRRQAINVLSGKLGDRVEVWRSNLIRAAALLEATIDFADEDVPVDVSPEVMELLSAVSGEIAKEIAGTAVAERIRTGFEVAIVGEPNVGKSTLLNALAGRDAAITSSVAGTTRDVIEVRMDLGGLPVTLLDTAGLRETDDEVESEGVSRAIDRARRADLRVFLVEQDGNLPLDAEAGDIRRVPKADLSPGAVNAVSGKSGEGLEQLIADIQSALAGRSAQAGLATHARHRLAMEQAQGYLEETEKLTTLGPETYDIAAAELRFAIRSLETLVGRIDVENLLDEIFASFCLGK